MFIARNLKQTNIIEYLLYMWQVEDLLRANQLDIERVKANIVERYDIDVAQKEELVTWYENLIDMMHREGREKEGHLQINQNVIIMLTDLHLQLMRSSKFPYYQAAYYKVLPYIVELRAKGHTKGTGELENCFEALYGVWMLKLQKRSLNEDTAKAMESIVTFMGLLSDYYFQEIKGELKFE